MLTPSVVFNAGHPHREQGRVAAQGSDPELRAGPEEHRFHPGQLGLLHWTLSRRGERNKEILPVCSSSSQYSQIGIINASSLRK